MNAQVSAPTTPNTYNISPGLQYNQFWVGTNASTVCSGAGGNPTYQAYTSLSGSSGLFAYLNSISCSSGTLTQNVTVYITSNTTETGAVALGSISSSTGVGSPYTITIEPVSATLFTLSTVTSPGYQGSQGLITFNGSPYITIDGEYNGDGLQHLYFQNYYTGSTNNSGGGATIYMYNGANHITIKNCEIEGNSQNVSNGVVTIGTATTTGGNNNIIISGNQIFGGNNWSHYIVYESGNASYPNNNITVSNNWIYNFMYWNGGANYESRGIYVSLDNSYNWTISGNSIYNTGTNSNNIQAAITFYPGNSSTGNTITGNYIGGSSPQCGAINTNSSQWSWNNSYYTSSYTTEDSCEGIHTIAGAVTISNNTITNIAVGFQGSTILPSNTGSYFSVDL